MISRFYAISFNSSQKNDNYFYIQGAGNNELLNTKVSQF